jgi:hypothetical protein
MVCITPSQNFFAHFGGVKCKIPVQFLFPLPQTAAAKYITQVWTGITAGSLLEWKNYGHDH